MDYNFLPDTDIEVSKICLGTMTWGRQNSEAEGHAQMDYAVEHGVNFFDTAELYPVPPRKEEQEIQRSLSEPGLKKLEIEKMLF